MNFLTLNLHFGHPPPNHAPVNLGQPFIQEIQRLEDRIHIQVPEQQENPVVIANRSRTFILMTVLTLITGTTIAVANAVFQE